MIKIEPKSILQWHELNKETSLYGRWVTLEHIQPILKKLQAPVSCEELGLSVLNRTIYKVSVGSGNIKVLIWSQMHGNESTGTKAVIDLLEFIKKPKEFQELRDQILNKCTLTIIPILNPDGAEAYTRENASKIDLNRDIIARKAPETKLLLRLLEKINPEYCFNLHDQRTIFTVGNTKESATLSFLAPSEDEKRTVSPGRKATMKVIVAMNELMQRIIPNQIGRYTDEFYPTATGDNFQKMGHNTVLVEAGHYKDDYEREKVRTFNFIALMQGLNYISSSEQDLGYEAYFDIPNNSENHLDIIYKNVYLKSENKKIDAGILFKESLKNGEVIFEPEIKRVGDLKNYTANSIIEEKGLIFTNKDELQRFLKKRMLNFWDIFKLIIIFTLKFPN